MNSTREVLLAIGRGSLAIVQQALASVKADASYWPEIDDDMALRSGIAVLRKGIDAPEEVFQQLSNELSS